MRNRHPAIRNHESSPLRPGLPIAVQPGRTLPDPGIRIELGKRISGEIMPAVLDAFKIRFRAPSVRHERIL
jgi:hypothetical protein